MKICHLQWAREVRTSWGTGVTGGGGGGGRGRNCDIIAELPEEGVSPPGSSIDLDR